jgi:hypothetical protein
MRFLPAQEQADLQKQQVQAHASRHGACLEEGRGAGCRWRTSMSQSSVGIACVAPRMRLPRLRPAIYMANEAESLLRCQLAQPSATPPPRCHPRI